MDLTNDVLKEESHGYELDQWPVMCWKTSHVVMDFTNDVTKEESRDV